jgi:hypothetical protein
MSMPMEIEAEVPQGCSVLSPTLHSMYINDAEYTYN